MSARPLLNRAYIIIGVAAIVMLATLVGGLVLQRKKYTRRDSNSTNALPAASGSSSSNSQRPRASD